MPRFFLECIEGDCLRISGQDARHIERVLRHKKGDLLSVCDGRGWERQCLITGFSGGEVLLSGGAPMLSNRENPYRLALYMGLPKGDKAERVIKAAVELGVNDITFFLSAFCVARPDEKARANRLARYQKIADEAAKQAGRAFLPMVKPFLPFEQAAEEAARSAAALMFYEKGGASLPSLLSGQPADVALITGCEGGFSREEAAFASKSGIVLCTLGKRILRCETAPLAALSAVNLLLGGLE